MAVLFAIICMLIVTIAIAVQLQRRMDERDYALRDFGWISALWLVLIVPGIRSVCSEILCRWSFSFAWWIQPLRNIAPFDNVSPTLLLVAAIVIISILTAYFFGYVLAWMLYGARRLFRLVV